MLKDDNILAEAVIRGVQMGLFVLGLKVGESISHIWDKSQPPTLGDIHWTENYVLAQPGTLQQPQGETAEVTSDSAGTSPYDTTSKKDRNDRSICQDDSTIPYTGLPQQIKRLTICLDPVEMPQVPALVDLLQSLKDAGGTVTLKAELMAESSTGLNKGTLELTVKELLTQHGFRYNWQEEK